MVPHEVTNHYILFRPCRRTIIFFLDHAEGLTGEGSGWCLCKAEPKKMKIFFYSFFWFCLTQSPPAPFPINLNRPILATAIFLTERSGVTNMAEILAILHMLVRIIHGEILNNSNGYKL